MVIQTLSQVLAAKQVGLVMYRDEKTGGHYTRIICCGCPECVHLNESNEITRSYPHYQTPPMLWDQRQVNQELNDD